MELPDVRYARSGDVSIAYQVVGEGPLDLVFVRGFAGDLLSAWEQPRLVRFVRDLASFTRVFLLDKRGTGLSDRVRDVPTLEARMDDLRAVMDDAGSERALLWTAQEGARLAALFAATAPERVSGLVLFDPTAKSRPDDGYPWALDDAAWRRFLSEVRDRWGTTSYLDERLAEWAPTLRTDQDFRGWFVSHMRRGLSPGAALAFFRMTRDSDVADVLPSVRVPAVVLASPENLDPAEYFASRLPGARLVELPRDVGIYHWVDDDAAELAMRETRALVAAIGTPRAVPESVLVTVLMTDIVGSTERAAALRDAAWRDLLARHHGVVRRELTRFRGEERDTAGDGFFATFDGPARAIQCARAVVEGVRELGLEVRAGLHTGECELHEGKVTGVAVSIGARVASLAAPGEVLVTRTVKDLVAGSELAFEPRGEHELRGVPGSWPIYAVLEGGA
ncbi:MAG: adenylate/guanylate cyclase domain-containing protein [Thermoleophilia bacterium]|nr:adenylate/guanylate cyclase domain-containing protein [Thermoleophilia bacterium]